MFGKESREDKDGVAYYASNLISQLSANLAGIKVFGKEQKKLINEGISEMNDLDDALTLKLNVETESRPELGKPGRVFCVTPKKVQAGVGISTIALEDTTDLERGARATHEYDPGTLVSSLGRTHNFGEKSGITSTE